MLVVINKLNNIVLGPHFSTGPGTHFKWSKEEPHHFYQCYQKNVIKKISCESSILIDESLITTKTITKASGFTFKRVISIN